MLSWRDVSVTVVLMFLPENHPHDMLNESAVCMVCVRTMEYTYDRIKGDFECLLIVIVIKDLLKKSTIYMEYILKVSSSYEYG